MLDCILFINEIIRSQWVNNGFQKKLVQPMKGSQMKTLWCKQKFYWWNFYRNSRAWLMKRNPSLSWIWIDEIILKCKSKLGWWNTRHCSWMRINL